MAAIPERPGFTPDEEFWQGRAVAVTGATGFLGSHLTDALVRLGARVVALVRDHPIESPIIGRWRSQVAEVSGSCEDQALVERMLGEYEVTTVFHLAAQSQVGPANRNPVATFTANITGTWSLLEAARRSPLVAQVVTASSDKAYGEQRTLPYSEDMALLASHPYDASKACADMLAQTYHHTYGLPVCVTRCGNFFGPGDQNWARLVPGTVRSALAGEPPLIRSDGTMIRDYLYVLDGVLAYLQLAEHMARDETVHGDAFNFSNESPVAVMDLVSLILERIDPDLTPVILGEASNEIPEQHLSATRAHERLAWWPRYTLEEGLDQTVAWYRDHLATVAADRPRPDPPVRSS